MLEGSCPQVVCRDDGGLSMARSKAVKKRATKKKARKKPIWERANPKRKHKKLSPQQKAKAKRLAREAGRPYPNMVDNARVARKK
jgi:hypothetical protein